MKGYEVPLHRSSDPHHQTRIYKNQYSKEYIVFMYCRTIVIYACAYKHKWFITKP